MIEVNERRLAYALLRLIVGVNFLGHGFIRVFHGLTAFAQGLVKSMAEAPLPAAFVLGFGYCVPCVELAIGVLLVLGLWTRWALVGASLLMAALMVGVTLKQDWSTAGVQLGYGLVLFVLLFLRAGYEASWRELLRGRGV